MLSCLFAIFAAAASPATPAQPQMVAPQVEQPAVVLSVEDGKIAKLRKLHLVRPDLISYPVAVDIYC